MSGGIVDWTWDRALRRLRETLGSDGWDVSRSRGGLRAQRGPLSVALQRDEDGHPAGPWQARMGDAPHAVLREHRGEDALEALDPVIAHARNVAGFCDGRTGLAPNPSKSWLGHRIWQAVRPQDER
jgi:hypothetical protein